MQHHICRGDKQTIFMATCNKLAVFTVPSAWHMDCSAYKNSTTHVHCQSAIIHHRNNSAYFHNVVLPPPVVTLSREWGHLMLSSRGTSSALQMPLKSLPQNRPWSTYITDRKRDINTVDTFIFRATHTLLIILYIQIKFQDYDSYQKALFLKH